METHVSGFSEIADQASKIGKLFFNIGLFSGFFFIEVYCLYIGYFPREITVGDGVLFALVALGCFLFYAVVWLGLFGFGVVTLQLTGGVVRLASRVVSARWLKFFTIMKETLPGLWVSSFATAGAFLIIVGFSTLFSCHS
jgi:hypothetical protein